MMGAGEEFYEHSNYHPDSPREDRDEGEKCGFVHRIMLPYGEARAVIVNNTWYYAACDALSAAGSIKTYTSNKVCLWKQKPGNIARFGATGKTLKLDRQSVYCMQLDGITKLLQDKNLAEFVHYFQEHEALNPVEAFINNPRYCTRSLLPPRFPIMQCQYPPKHQHIHSNYHSWAGGAGGPRAEPRVESVVKQEIDYKPDPSHAWTAFNPVTGAHLSTPLCSRCGASQNIPASAAACVVALSSNTTGKQQEAQAVVQNMKSKFDGLMGELQTQFIGIEKSFTELIVDMRLQFAEMENRLADMAKNKRRLEPFVIETSGVATNQLTPISVEHDTTKRARCKTMLEE